LCQKSAAIFCHLNFTKKKRSFAFEITKYSEYVPPALAGCKRKGLTEGAPNPRDGLKKNSEKG